MALQRGPNPGFVQRRSTSLMCGLQNKTRYRSRKLILSVKKRAEERTGELLDVYKCPFCKDWHYTKARNKK